MTLKSLKNMGNKCFGPKKDKKDGENVHEELASSVRSNKKNKKHDFDGAIKSEHEVD